MRKPITTLFAAIHLALTVPLALADTTISYQGQLEDGGEPFDGPIDMSFTLHEHEIDDLPVGPTISLAQVAVDDGLFTVDLDFGNVFTGQTLWLEASVDATPLSPRQRITAVPMALNVPAGAGSNWQRVNDDIHYNSGRVGIGRSDPQFALEVFSDEPLDLGSGNSAILGGRINVTGPDQLIGLIVAAVPDNPETEAANGIIATTSANDGVAIVGDAQGFDGPGIGIKGHTQSNEGFAAHFSGHVDSRNYWVYPNLATNCWHEAA